MIARNISRSRGGALRRRLWFGLAALLGLVSPAVQAGLPLLAERSSPFDLAVTGRLEGAPPGSTRFVRWSDLRALPTHKIVMEGEFVAGEQTMTVVYLSDVRKALPARPGGRHGSCHLHRWLHVRLHRGIRRETPAFCHIGDQRDGAGFLATSRNQLQSGSLCDLRFDQSGRLGRRHSRCGPQAALGRFPNRAGQL